MNLSLFPRHEILECKKNIEIMVSMAILQMTLKNFLHPTFRNTAVDFTTFLCFSANLKVKRFKNDPVLFRQIEKTKCDTFFAK